VKFIHCFDSELKDKLIQNGFKLLVSTDSLFIFENSSSISFDFNQLDKKQFIFSNKMIF
jgi:hypothetical protein